jgi:hypothetical protein
MTEPKPSYDAGGEQPDAKTVLEKPSRMKCACGHIAAEHGACCFECPCEASMHEVMKVGYRDALAASEARVEALEREKAAGEFWSGQVYPEGATAEQVQAELTDYRTFMHETAIVYDNITHGRISKVNTLASVVISVAEECYQDDLQQALADEREAFGEFDADTIRVCAETIWGKHRDEANEGIRLARHNFLQRLATALAPAPNAPLDAPDAASPRQGLEDDSSLEHDCLAGTGWASEVDDGA